MASLQRWWYFLLIEVKSIYLVFNVKLKDLLVLTCCLESSSNWDVSTSISHISYSNIWIILNQYCGVLIYWFLSDNHKTSCFIVHIWPRWCETACRLNNFKNVGQWNFHKYSWPWLEHIHVDDSIFIELLFGKLKQLGCQHFNFAHFLLKYLDYS